MTVDYLYRYKINDELIVGERRAKRRTRCGLNGNRIIKKLQKYKDAKCIFILHINKRK